MRETGAESNDLLVRLAADDRLRLSSEDVGTLMAEPLTFTGAAVAQVDAVLARIEKLVADNPEAAGYRPGAIV
jgi:adenylosuccinate lyase